MVSSMGGRDTYSRKPKGPDMNRVLTLFVIGGILFTFLAEGAVLDKNMDEFYSKEDIGLLDPIRDKDRHHQAASAGPWTPSCRSQS